MPVDADANGALIQAETMLSSALDDAKAVAKGASLSMFGMIAQRGLGYIFAVVVARSVGAAAYGFYNWTWAAVILITSFALLGLNQGSQRYMAHFRALGDVAGQGLLVRRLVLLVVAWGGLTATGMALGAESIARLSGQDVATISTLLRWFALAIPFSALLLLLSSLSDGQRQIKCGVLSRDIVQPSVALLLVWILLRAGAGLAGVVQAYVVSMVLAVLVALFFLREYFHFSASPAPSGFSLREVLGFSLPFLPMVLLRQVDIKLEIYLLGFLSGPEDVGIFSAAASTAMLVSFGLNAIVRIYSTLAAELYTKKELNQLEHLLQTVTRWSVSLSLPGILAIVLFNQEMLGLFGARFAATGGAVLMVLALGQMVNAMTGPVGVTLTMAGYSRLILLNNLLILVLGVVLGWHLISVWGVIGAAVGNAVVMTALNLVYMIEARYVVGVRSFSARLLRPCGVGGLTFLVVWPMLHLFGGWSSTVRLLVGLLLLAMIYFPLLWVSASRDDKEIVMAILRRIKIVSGIKNSVLS